MLEYAYFQNLISSLFGIHFNSKSCLDCILCCFYCWAK